MYITCHDKNSMGFILFYFYNEIVIKPSMISGNPLVTNIFICIDWSLVLDWKAKINFLCLPFIFAVRHLIENSILNKMIVLLLNLVHTIRYFLTIFEYRGYLCVVVMEYISSRCGKIWAFWILKTSLHMITYCFGLSPFDFNCHH